MWIHSRYIFQFRNYWKKNNNILLHNYSSIIMENDWSLSNRDSSEWLLIWAITLLLLYDHKDRTIFCLPRCWKPRLLRETTLLQGRLLQWRAWITRTWWVLEISEAEWQGHKLHQDFVYIYRASKFWDH